MGVFAPYKWHTPRGGRRILRGFVQIVIFFFTIEQPLSKKTTLLELPVQAVSIFDSATTENKDGVQKIPYK